MIHHLFSFVSRLDAANTVSGETTSFKATPAYNWTLVGLKGISAMILLH
jgi:hypothetical protein